MAVRAPGAQGSATTRLYSWAELQIAQVGEGERLKLTDLTEQALKEFAVDPEWVTAFVSESLESMIRSVAQKAVASTRGHYRKYVFRDTVMGVQAYATQTTQEAATLSMKLMQKWGSWMEHTGQSHLRLLDMTRADLLAAAEERERRANRELEVARLWRAMADAMPGGATTVREAFKLEDIEIMSVKIRQEAGTFIDPSITPASQMPPTDQDQTPPAEEEKTDN